MNGFIYLKKSTLLRRRSDTDVLRLVGTADLASMKILKLCTSVHYSVKSKVAMSYTGFYTSIFFRNKQHNIVYLVLACFRIS